MIKPNPFTPKSGLEPKVFINRDKEIELFLKRIREGKQGVTNHFIVNGAWGSGKTSLLRYLKLIAQEQKCITSYFLASEFDGNARDVDVVTHFIQSIVNGLSYKLNEKSSRLFKMIKGFGIQVFGTGFNLTFKSDEMGFTDSQIYLMNALLNVWDDVKKQTDLLVILIDDVQNYSKIIRFFTTLKNVLSHERIIKETKILFVLSSTIDGWKTFLQVNHPIGRFFIPRLELANFDKDNTFRLIDGILKDTGVTFVNSVKENVFKYTDGHLFEVHVLCSALYDNQVDGKVTDQHWDKGFEEALFYLGNAVYDGVIEGISNNEVELVKCLKPFDNNSAVYINRHAEVKSVNEYLRRLTEKNVLKTTQRGEYVMLDKLFYYYLHRKSQKSQN